MKLARRSFLSHSAGALGVSSSSRILASGLAAEFEKLEIIDTHEHLLAEKDRVSQPVDFFTLAGHYAMNDVISAGLSKADAARLGDPKAPAMERWRLFEPHWKAAQFTGYGQCLRIAMRDIYGAEDISSANIERLNEVIASHNKPGLYRKVLKERARIAYCGSGSDLCRGTLSARPGILCRRGTLLTGS